MEIRTLSRDDVPACQALSADRDWLRDDLRWALLAGIGEVFGIDDPDGGLAGAVAHTRYSDGYSAIGMLLVARRWARRGLGRALMRHAMQRAGGVVWLSATESGRPLYESLGFHARGACTTYVGRLPAAPSSTRPATADDLPAVAERDTAVFGDDRGRLLDRLPDLGRIRVAERGHGAA